MKKICVVTAARSEYGLLKNVMLNIKKDPDLKLQVIVTGSHLSKNFGYTVNEIIEDGFEIDEKVEMLIDSDTPSAICKSMGLASIGFSNVFERLKPEMLIVLGDRYELIPICSTALIFKIPIAHISGGEITEGAVDDAFRHCITKMSYLHFPACDEYRKRIIQLGEDPNRVFNFGDVGVENITNMIYKNKEELGEIIGLDLNIPSVSITFHPTTLEDCSMEEQMKELLEAISLFKDVNFVFTKANADTDGSIINALIDEFVEKHDNCKAFPSLGMKNYISLLHYCVFMMGNSSSGIVEAPALGITSINIGNRQKGRLQASSIINCNPVKDEIVKAMNLALSEEYIENAKITESKYGKDNTSTKIVETLKSFLKQRIDLKKHFYDLTKGMTL